MDSGYIQPEKVLNWRSCDLLHMDTQTVGGEGLLPAAFHLLPSPNAFLLRPAAQAQKRLLLIGPALSPNAERSEATFHPKARLPGFRGRAAPLSKDVFFPRADVHLEILRNNANACNVTLVLLVRSFRALGQRHLGHPRGRARSPLP